MRAKLASDKEELERQARLSEPEIAQMYADAAGLQCRKDQSRNDQIDPAKIR